MIPAALADHDTDGTTTEWAVYSFSPGLACHVLDEFTEHDQAQAARDRIRHDHDASALLVHRTRVTGRWTPDTTHPSAPPDTRTALLTYVGEYNADALDNRQAEVQALLEALRPDMSPMWRWAMFANVAAAVAVANTEARERFLSQLTTPGGGS